MSAARKVDPRWLQLNKAIRAAEKSRGMSRDDHAALVLRITGRDSLKGAKLHEMNKVLNALNGKAGKASAAGRLDNADPLVSKMRALWISLHHLGEVTDPSDNALIAFAARQIGVTPGIQWRPSPVQAPKIIEALKAWCERVGVVWTDGSPRVDVYRAQCRKIYGDDVDAGAVLDDLAGCFPDLSHKDQDALIRELGAKIRAAKAEQEADNG
ncbi:MAG: phage protein GemA/Gp16 family protein [Magnetospiraceae bacterium]